MEISNFERRRLVAQKEQIQEMTKDKTGFTFLLLTLQHSPLTPLFPSFFSFLLPTRFCCHPPPTRAG